MGRSLITSLLIFVLVVLSKCKINENSDVTMGKSGQKVNVSSKSGMHGVYDRKSYQALLKAFRQQHSMAVKSVMAINDKKRAKTLLVDVVSKMKNVLIHSKKIIEANKFTPNNEVFPTEDPLREAVAKVIENTAFYFELAVFLPDYLDHFTNKDLEMKPLMTWCYEFVEKMDITDVETKKLMINGAQELLIVSRPEGYENPNRSLYQKNAKRQEAFNEYQQTIAEKQTKKRPENKLKLKKTGPKLTRVEL